MLRALSRWAIGVGAVIRRDAQTLLTYRFGLFAQYLGVLFSLTLFYYVSRLITVSHLGSSDEYFEFVVVGLIILQVLNSTLQTPPGLVRGETIAGTFERMVVSPFGPVGGLLAMLAFPLVNAIVTGFVMLGFASLVFDLSVRWSTAWLALPLGVLGALTFACFGVAAMALVLVVKQATAGTTWIVAGISLVSGLYFPVTLLPAWIRWASDVQPFTPVTDLLRNVLVGTPIDDPTWLNLAKIVGFTLAVLPAAAVALRSALRYGRRRGTITEY